MPITTNLPVLIILISLIFIIGIVLGVTAAQLIGRSNKSQEAEPGDGTLKSRGRLQEILRLWRDPDTGRVITEYQNRAIRDPRTLNSSEQDYLVRLAKDWTTWLSGKGTKPLSMVEGGKEIPAVPPFVDNPAEAAIPPDQPSLLESADPAELSTPADSPSLPDFLDSNEPVSLPDFTDLVEPVNMPDLDSLEEPAGSPGRPASVEAEVPAGPPPQVPTAVTTILTPPVKLPAAPVIPAKVVPLPPPPVALSIVQQVDEILQDRLNAHPVPGLSIRLAEDPKDGVIVWVNTNKYVGIESVTDPEVRAIIRSAVVEWNHRSEK